MEKASEQQGKRWTTKIPALFLLGCLLPSLTCLVWTGYQQFLVHDLYREMKMVTDVVSQAGVSDITVEKRDTLPISSSQSCVGPRGPAGLQGPLGPPGRDGENGVPGVPGRNGRPGAAGAPGAPGRDGVDGSPGLDGVDGGLSAPGIDGADGRDGIDANGLESYIRWGQDTCEGLIYNGYAAGLESGSSATSGSQDLRCIPRNPNNPALADRTLSLGPTMSAVKVNLMGVTPPQFSAHWSAIDGKRLQCAVCLAKTNEAVVKFGENACMKPGEKKSEWNAAYNGYAMAPFKSTDTSVSSGVICVDNKPDAELYPSPVTNPGAPEFSFVRTGFGFSQNNKIVPCALCLKE